MNKPGAVNIFIFAALLTLGCIVGVSFGKRIPVNAPATNPIIRVDNVLVLPYEGLNYVVGYIDTLTNEAQVLSSEITSFLLANAKDAGIRKAAEFIGFRGPQTVTLTEVPPDAP